MGDFSEHVLFGLLLGVTVFFVSQDLIPITGSDAVLGSLGVFIGSVVPDIDHENSYVFRSSRALLSLLSGISAFVILPEKLSYRFAASIMGFTAVFVPLYFYSPRHRGITHSFSFAITLSSLVVVAGVLLLNSAVLGFSLFVGIISHLLLDGEFKF